MKSPKASRVARLFHFYALYCLFIMKPTLRRFCAPMLAAWLLVPACTMLAPQRGHAQPLPDRRTLKGRVLGFRGAPLGGAFLEIKRTDDAIPATFWGTRILTDARGEFSLPNAEDGSYYFTINADGYAAENNRAFTLSATSGAFQVSLLKLSNLRLRLLTQDGAPLLSAPITARVRSDAGTKVLRLTTDSSGYMSVVGLTPGSYNVDVLSRGQGFGVLPNAEVRPDANDGATDVKLQSGGKLRVLVREAGTDGKTRELGGATLFVTPAPRDDAQARAEGRLSNTPDAADMSLLWLHYDRAGLVTRDGDGSVELSDLAPGRYLLRPFLSGYATPDARPVDVKAGETIEATFDLTTSVANVTFATLPLVLKDASGKPFANADWNIQMRFLGGDGEENALPLPPGGAPDGVPQELLGGAIRRVHSDADGKIMLYPVRSGKWRVNVSTPRDIAPRIELPGLTITVKPDAEATTIQAKG